MKVFISADIEGVTTSTFWNETDSNHHSYKLHAEQMTNEVLACIAGAKKAGATEFVVNDAHASGNNIIPTKMPKGVKLMRGWSGHPYSMADGIDKSFDAAMFVGYHAASGRTGNPMAHTMTSSNVHTIKINDVLVSEFYLYSFACALEKVPTVFLSGDETICSDSIPLHPMLITCPVKDSSGRLTINYSTEETLPKIEELAEKALRQDLKKALTTLPGNFKLEIHYKNIPQVNKAIWFPGVTRQSDTSVEFKTDNFFEVLRTISWIL